MKILREKEIEYKKWKNNNIDPYGNACFAFAERWADLLEEFIQENPHLSLGDIIKKHAEETSRDADTEGITGFMYGVAIQIISQCWEYGEFIRKWHNEKYDYDGEGSVNPAILNIGE